MLQSLKFLSSFYSARFLRRSYTKLVHDIYCQAPSSEILGKQFPLRFFNDKIKLIISPNIEKFIPYIWLRDQCSCIKCYNIQTDQCTDNLSWNINKDLRPESINIFLTNNFPISFQLSLPAHDENMTSNHDHNTDELTGYVSIKWPDDHESIYSFEYLKYLTISASVNWPYHSSSFSSPVILHENEWLTLDNSKMKLIYQKFSNSGYLIVVASTKYNSIKNILSRFTTEHELGSNYFPNLHQNQHWHTDAPFLYSNPYVIAIRTFNNEQQLSIIDGYLILKSHSTYIKQLIEQPFVFQANISNELYHVEIPIVTYIDGKPVIRYNLSYMNNNISNNTLISSWQTTLLNTRHRHILTIPPNSILFLDNYRYLKQFQQLNNELQVCAYYSYDEYQKYLHPYTLNKNSFRL